MTPATRPAAAVWVNVMTEFSMKIAGRVGAVGCLFESTPAYFHAYVTREPADFSVTVTREDVTAEAEAFLQEALEEGFRVRTFTDPFLERAAIQRKFAARLLSDGVLVLHGSVVAVDGQGYLFTADSGTGKSTHTRLWRQLFPDRAVMVNDDQPFLRITEAGVWACGSPWSGKHGLDSNITVPLRGICFLQRGPENRIQRLAPSTAVPALRRSCRFPDPAQWPLIDTLAAQVPLWHMECNKNPDAAAAAYAAMSASTGCNT